MTLFFMTCILIKFMFHHAVQCRSAGGIPYRPGWLKPLLKGLLRKLRSFEGRLPGVRGEAGMAGRL